MLEAYNAALGASVAKDNTSKEQHAVKDKALAHLVKGVKSILR